MSVIQEEANRVRPLVERIFALILLSKGRDLFRFLAEMEQDDRNYAVDLLGAFKADKSFKPFDPVVLQVWKQDPEMMYTAFKARPQSGRDMDEVAVIAKRMLTPDRVAKYVHGIELIRQANGEKKRADEALVALRKKLNTSTATVPGAEQRNPIPTSLAGDVPVKRGEEDTIIDPSKVGMFSRDSDGKIEADVLVFADPGATEEDVRAALKEQLGLSDEDILNIEPMEIPGLPGSGKRG